MSGVASVGRFMLALQTSAPVKSAPVRLARRRQAYAGRLADATGVSRRTLLDIATGRSAVARRPVRGLRRAAGS